METLEELRGQEQHRGSSSSSTGSSSRIVSRHGHDNRIRNVSAAIETRNSRIQHLRVEVKESTSGRMDTDKFDSSTIAFDCPDEEFRSIEASLCLELHRTTSNEPLRIVRQTRGQKGLEAWPARVRRYDQRNMPDTNSAYAALISNICERDTAKDVEQFDDILRAFINEMNKFENRFGKIRDEEKMLADKKLMPESLLNNRFRGTTMSYSELLLALENIINDKVATVRTVRRRKNDTSAPMEIGMAAKEDGENASQEGDQRIVDLALQAVYQGTDKGKWSFGKGQSWNEKGGKGGKNGGKNSWQKGSGKKGSKGQEKGGKGEMVRRR